MQNSNFIKESVFFLFLYFFHKSPIDISQNTSVHWNIVRETLIYFIHLIVFPTISASFGFRGCLSDILYICFIHFPVCLVSSL